MATSPAQLDRATFEDQLAEAVRRLEVASDVLSAPLLARLFAHYQELGRWAPRLNLVGPAAFGELLPRHYAESLVALPWLAGRPKSGRRCLLDVGSGAGFPGLLLAAGLPEWRCLLFESRGKKAAFLRAAARRMELRVEVVAERIHDPLPTAVPGRIDCLTLRAVRLEDRLWQRLAERLDSESRILQWTTLEAEPSGLERWLEVDERMPLGGQRRYLALWKKKERKTS